MQTKPTNVVFLFALLFSLTSCQLFGGWNCIEGKEKVTSEKRNLEEFTGVELNLSGTVYLNRVNAEAPKTIEISTHADLLQYIKTEVVEGKLIITADPCIEAEDGLTFQLTVGDLKSLQVNGSGDFITSKKLDVGTLELGVNGSGDMELELKAGAVNIGINGSGDVELNGDAQNVSISINGSGDVEGKKFETVDANVSIQGSGDTEIRVTGTLEVNIMGSGDVTYSGKPENVKTNVMGSGDVEGR